MPAAVAAHGVAQGQAAGVPNRKDSLKFAAIGDNGTGDKAQYELAAQMSASHDTFPFDIVIMLGDNIYGGQKPRDFVDKFEKPYKPLLDAGVRFYAALGNHDSQTNRFYKPWNMNGERYYAFSKKNVKFFVLDSDYMDPEAAAVGRQRAEGRARRLEDCLLPPSALLERRPPRLGGRPAA